MTAAELLALVASMPPETELGGVAFGVTSVTRASGAERQARYRERKAALRNALREGGKGGVRPPNGVEAELAEKRGEISEPPDRLDQGKVTRVTSRVTGAARPWRRVPSDWKPNEGHARIAAEMGVDMGLASEGFRDHEFARPRKDADAAFRNWLRSPLQQPKARQRGGQWQSPSDMQRERVRRLEAEKLNGKQAAE